MRGLNGLGAAASEFRVCMRLESSMLYGFLVWVSGFRILETTGSSFEEVGLELDPPADLLRSCKNLQVSAYVCKQGCVCVYTYMYVKVYIYIYRNTFTCIFMHACVYVCLYVCTCVCMYVCTYACKYVCKISVCACTSVYIHTHTHNLRQLRNKQAGQP